MSKRTWRKISPWLFGVAMIAFLLASIKYISYFRYENSDDILLVKGFMGFEGGVPSQFNLFTHLILAKFLTLLHSIKPTIAWFSVYQLGLLCVSGVVIVKSIMQISVRKGRSILLAALIALVFLGVYATFAFSRITYTSTAAFACAAVVAQIISIDKQSSNKQFILGLLPAVCLFVCAYLLRAQAAIPSLPFLGLALVFHFSKRDESDMHYAIEIKQICLYVAVFAAIISALFLVHTLEVSRSDQEEYINWSESRTQLFDYTPFENDIEPALSAQSGLSEAEISLLREWNFMDEDITQEKLDCISASYPSPTIKVGLSNVVDFFLSNHQYIASFLILICAAIFYLMVQRRDKVLLIATIAVFAVAAVMLGYLGIKGRVLFRAVDCILFPMATLLIGILLEYGQIEASCSALKKAFSVGICIIMILSVGVSGMKTWKTLRAGQDEVSLQREAELEAFALQNPDKLILRQPSLLRDTRLFPDVSNGIPINIMIWGDWYARTPSWYGQLETFGIDGRAFRAEDWLNDTLLYVTASDAPPQALTDYIAEGIDETVQVELFEAYGTLNYFSFSAMN